MRRGLASLSFGRAVALLFTVLIFALPLQSARADVEADMVPGYDLPGGDIRGFSLADPDPGLCRQACDNDNRCVGWTFVKPGHIQYYAACYLKDRLPANSAFNQNVISGAKNGRTRPPVVPGAARTDFSMMFGVDLHGSDLRSFAMPSGDPAQCEAACDGDNRCKGWTFIKPGPQGPPICFLKNAIPTPTGAQHVISGVKASPRVGLFPKPATPPPSPQIANNQGGGNQGPGNQGAGNQGAGNPNGGINNGQPGGGVQGGNQGGGNQGGQPGGVRPGGVASGTGVSGPPGIAPGAVPSTGTGTATDWGVWASAAGGKWGDPCAILYNAAQVAGNRYDGAPTQYQRVRTRATQRDADLDIDQFGLHNRDLPDGIVKLISCRPKDPAQPGGGATAGNTGGGTNVAQWMTGNFDSSYGKMTLSPGGGSYDYYGGTLAVTKITGATMEGTWRQTDKGSCNGVEGTAHGKFVFTFSADGFSGTWGSCDAEPNHGGWNGTRVK